MEQLSEYLLSVTGAAMISSVVLRLLEGRGSTAMVGKMVAGIFMALVVISPLSQVRISDVLDLMPDVTADAQEAAAAGEASAKNALAQSISTQLETYILDKAVQLGATLTVQVELTEDAIPIPCSVRLQGTISPYAKSKLQSIIRDELGIEKENQIWT